MGKGKSVLRRWVGTPARDGQVLPITRWVARFIIPFLAAAFLVLYGLPDQTTKYFAWTIRPEMTPIVMGAGYGAGVYFFYRVSTVDEWHTVAPVFLGIATFTWLMAIATVLHWGKFNHSHFTFDLWVFLYAVTPVLIPAIWALNRRTDSGELAGSEPRLPQAVRVLGGGIGVIVTASAIVLFVAPDPMIGVWPWTVSPFTARILAGWFALFGVVNGVVVLDPRWSAARILVQSQILGFTLVLIGVVRVWDNFDPSNVLTWGVVGGMTLYLIAILSLYIGMETR
ncbi:hypothetical protein [Halapricum hydrolyticum]|uniref:Uncharacterized protein n=1 Tax=Halapricum hydrolyticum TaxID=2979991 RepID=A0AAE3LE46_9EURY|nr:hypothetical protein [Halapricum hydrolyticum]MCU4716890.1 hypothetical protein [Halapricum hydrolyticum]MCU4725505.1 hypothetical protein [Halapricum hydrolyticum]